MGKISKTRFLPSRDLTEKDWCEMFAVLDNERQHDNFFQITRILASMRILDPLREINISEDDLKKIYDVVMHCRSRLNMCYDLVSIAKSIAMLNDPRISNWFYWGDRKTLKEMLGYYRDDPRTFKTFDAWLALGFNLLSPGDLQIKHSEWGEMLDYLEELRKSAKQALRPMMVLSANGVDRPDSNTPDFAPFAELAAITRLVDPSRFDKSGVVTDEDWQAMLSTLADTRRWLASGSSFIHHAANLAILSASGVCVNYGSIKLI